MSPAAAGVIGLCAMPSVPGESETVIAAQPPRQNRHGRRGGRHHGLIDRPEMLLHHLSRRCLARRAPFCLHETPPEETHHRANADSLTATEASSPPPPPP